MFYFPVPISGFWHGGPQYLALLLTVCCAALLLQGS